MKRYGSRGGVPLRLFFFAAGCLCVILILGLLSCRTHAPTSPAETLTLRLDAVPDFLKADSASVSAIWATVLENGRPVKDSTAVYFATTMGRIDAQALTKDGLARASFSGVGQAGMAIIIAQVLAVRDTVTVTVY